MESFRWTAKKGMEPIHIIIGESGSSASKISTNDSVIVGQASDGVTQDQMRLSQWKSEKGMESVEKMLTEKGILPAQWSLTKVTAITPSKTVLMGEGTYNDGSPKALTHLWRAVIPRTNHF